MTKLKVAFVTSHPIQYQVPVFRHLANDPDIEFKVFFAQIPDAAAQGAEFGVAFEWDLPLLQGYDYEVLQNVARTPSVTTFSGCDTPEIANKLRTGGFNAVVVNGWVVKSCLQALLACRRFNLPCLVRGEANLLRPRSNWKRWLQARLVRRYSGYLYIGEANRKFYRRYGVSDSKLFPARYCVENERFARAAETIDQGRVRQQWRIPKESVCFLYCGKFIAKKHPLELLQAYHLAASQSSTPIHLLMVGDGELREHCESFARQHELPVTFAGFLNQREIVDAYVASDCLVLPSDHGETWGLVVNEAMACSRPAIVSDQVGCREDLITDGATGGWFPFGDWHALAGLMNRFAQERDLLVQMGRNASHHISEYSPLHAAEGIKSGVLTTLVRCRRRSPEPLPTT